MGSWGQDFEKTEKFSTLIESILKNTDTPRLRLSSLEPWDIERDFFSLWSDDRLARHLHLPLQSGCRATLKRMARKTTPEAYARLVETARAAIPDVAITTDIIVGFPGETESEFTESFSYTAQMNFARGHVFTYSERPGTAASRMPGSVPYPVRKFRNAEMRKVLEGTERSYRNRFIGKHLPVLWESATALGPKSWRLQGLTDNYLRVASVAPEPLWNQIQLVVITGSNGPGLIGKVVEM
jgi:threonylcarbamoyladenosine tRNA methylthiotransferase MtaB